ncbi:MAG TPA: heterodisulfide reductase-related iron-sulfur binding cluster [Actinomycetota bacterium]|nr:heterodisulfide reductase-related iron-sulfur binding cluster [Actinomycetota bacterium]
MTDDRMVTKNAAGEDYDLSAADSFSYSDYFDQMIQAERLQISRDEVAWLQSYRAPARPVDVVLNLSCGAQHIPHLMLVQVALFRALGVDFVATAGRQFCCGRIYQRYGKEEMGDRIARSAIARFASWGATVNVQCCGSCLIEFSHHVRRIREETGAAPFEVVHITRFLLQRLKEMGDAIPWKRSIPLRVLLHAEGAEVHPTKEEARADVIETLAMIPGVRYVGLVENPSLGQPCATRYPGGPSVLNDITPHQYRQVLEELWEQARRAGADAIVTHHHMCHQEWSKFSSERLPVVHYQSLLAEALGISIPDRFQALWRLRDPEAILEASRRYWSSWGIEEEEARRLVHAFFVPSYAAALHRCPCDGACAHHAAPW